MARKPRTVVIAGGGIVGRTLALALATQSHITVRLFVGSELARDERASAVSDAARRLFGRLGVWPSLAAEAQSISEMVLTDSRSDDVVRPEVLTFAGNHDEGVSAHMVPNQVLAVALAERCAALGIVADPRAVTFYEEDDRGVTVELDDGTAVAGDILVAADGRRSKLRAIAGIEVVEHDYEQSGIVGTVAHSEPHHGVARQHFLPHGPFAMLPLTGNRSSIVWTERPAFARELERTDPMLAGLEIERAFGLSLGRLSVEGALQVFPIVGLLARKYASGRLAVVGDAAHVIHPLAGQGLNLGLRDAAALAEVLVDADRIAEDLANALPRYERWRRPDNAQMAFAMGGLNLLFSRKSDVLRAVRSIGLGIVEERDDLKDMFMREAAGHAGDVPLLMRGDAI